MVSVSMSGLGSVLEDVQKTSSEEDHRKKQFIEDVCWSGWILMS